MPQQFAEVNYQPLQAAGRSFAQVPMAIGVGVEQYQQTQQLEQKNQQAYKELTDFFDKSGIHYDKEMLKPHKGEQNYEDRAKKSIVPLFDRLKSSGVDVDNFVKDLKSTPSMAAEQVHDLLLKHKAGQTQQAITGAVQTAAAGRSSADIETGLAQQGFEKLPPEQAAQTVKPESLITTPPAQTSAEFHERMAAAPLPKDVTTTDITQNPAYALKSAEFGAKATQAKLDETKREKAEKVNLEVAKDIWSKVKAGNKLYKDGAEVTDASFKDIFDNPDQYSLEPGVAPRAPGARGSATKASSALAKEMDKQWQNYVGASDKMGIKKEVKQKMYNNWQLYNAAVKLQVRTGGEKAMPDEQALQQAEQMLKIYNSLNDLLDPKSPRYSKDRYNIDKKLKRSLSPETFNMVMKFVKAGKSYEEIRDNIAKELESPGTAMSTETTIEPGLTE